MILLICGYKGSGKDTLANHLVSKHAFQHHKVSHHLKQMLMKIFGFTYEQVESNLKDEIDDRWKISPRTAMKFVGTDMFQFKIQELLPGIQRNFWSKLMVNDIRSSRTNNCPIVISDLRFIHEYEYIMDAFPNETICIVKVLRSSVKIQTLYTDESENEHTKMTFNYILPNNGTTSQFCDNVDKLIAHLEKQKQLDTMYLIE
jgi:dephospho-CoA kinase